VGGGGGGAVAPPTPPVPTPLRSDTLHKNNVNTVLSQL